MADINSGTLADAEEITRVATRAELEFTILSRMDWNDLTPLQARRFRVFLGHACDTICNAAPEFIKAVSVTIDDVREGGDYPVRLKKYGTIH